MTTKITFDQFFSKRHKNIPFVSAEAVLKLVEEGCTVPFIARYRKERTNNLDEVQVHDVITSYETWTELESRKDFILKEIAKRGELTSELEAQLVQSESLAELEELYRPYKRKKKTKATLAKEAGLEPLANWIWELAQKNEGPSPTLEVKAKEFINSEKGFVKYEDILRGAAHILTEKIYNNPDLRNWVKEDYYKNGKITSKVGPKFKTNSKYEMYKEFEEKFESLNTVKASHRYLALRRGWNEEELKVSIEGSDEELLQRMCQWALPKGDTTPVAHFIKDCVKNALQVHIIPSVSNEMHRVLKENSDQAAIQVFAENVRKILLSSPFGPKVVIGVDPGLRTGCKVALVDSTGRYISHTVLNILGDKAEENAQALFKEVFKQLKVDAVAVGNGTAGRETEAFLRKVFKVLNIETPVILVNESGASVYSASEVAREEFPELDLTVRGAISIARRLQDPLAELVKVEPKSIGVGQYQHDVSQNQLKKSLNMVVESCVNQVGVNVNTASKSLLQYVSGIGPATAQSIISYRGDKGLFKDRNELQGVGKLTSKSYEQAVGFLRVPDSKNPLDATGVHPERYSAVKDMAKEAGVTISQLIGHASEILSPQKEKWISLVGEYTFNDILKELDNPGLDPRDPYKVFKFREDIHGVNDLQDGMVCPGIVSNVTNFGAFVDIGVHQDGLVHISEMSHSFIQDPRSALSPGDQVQVKVLKVDKEKNQISLTMLLEAKKEMRVTKSPEKRQFDKPRKKTRGKASHESQKDPKRHGKAKSSVGRGKHSKGTKPGGRPNKPARPAFNNPFADLASALNKSDS